jgi:hypothetical protein
MLALTLTVTPDDALNGAVGRNNCRSLATMLSGGLVITHVRNLQGHHRIVNPVMPALHGWQGLRPKSAFVVAIGGKADMGWCSAHVCF